MGPHGITVNVVSPLAYSPAMTLAISADPAMEERLARRIPLGRIGDPESDIGSAVAYLIGPAARYVTGQTLRSRWRPFHESLSPFATDTHVRYD